MRPTFKLGSLSGIDIGVHWSIGVIAFLLVSSLSGTILPDSAPGYSSGAYLFGGLVMAAVFLASIVAHEMGHSLVARRNGIDVRGVTLFALGGVASLESEPTRPGVAARVALAGPAVSVVIALATVAAALGLSAVGSSTLLVAGLIWLGVINGSLAVFNMLPAFPLDGGRVWHAILWWRKGDRLEATVSAARLGRWIGWSLVLFGFWQFSRGGPGLWLALIGWFIVGAAKAESIRARLEMGQNAFQNQFRVWMSGSPGGPGGTPPWFGSGGAAPGQPPGQQGPPPPQGQSGQGQPGSGQSGVAPPRARGPVVEGTIIEVDGRAVDE